MVEGQKKFWVVGGVAAIAVPLMVAATAFACANLATIKPNKNSGTPGVTKVYIKGFNFSTRSDSSAVQIRMNSRRGKVLDAVRPNSRGRIESIITVPKAKVGKGYLLATQTTGEGRPVAGTPARHPFTIRSSSGSSSTVPAAWGSPQQGPPTAGGPASIPVTLIGGAGLALVALSAAGLAVSRRPARMRPAHSLSS
jgi:hypothetical protein